MQLIRAVLTLAIALAPITAHAFVAGAAFDADPLVKPDMGYFPGAGGIAFTGAPRWSGHTCVVCHTDPPKHIGIRLEADQPALFSGGWEPKKQYHLRVVLENEIEAVEFAKAGDTCGTQDDGTYKRCDTNGFALEMDDGGGNPVGTFVSVANNACATTPPADSTTYILADKSAVLHTDSHKGLTAWDFCWTAPAAGAGTITAFVAVVDGNGGLGTEAVPNDPIDDDVATGTVPIAELAAEGNGTDAGGCAAGGEAGLTGVIAVGIAIALRRRRALAGAVLAIATLGGCVHVRPRQREVLARPNMKFAPDPAEDELDLHMQESREGSSGGYGSSGGGCGCN
jgi:MYXO-CTERM domain-containing protein